MYYNCNKFLSVFLAKSQKCLTLIHRFICWNIKYKKYGQQMQAAIMNSWKIGVFPPIGF